MTAAAAGRPTRPSRSNIVINGLIVTGAALLVAGLFLPWFSGSTSIKMFRSIEATGWTYPRVSWPLLACAVVAVVGVLAPIPWLRYPFALLAGCTAGGIAWAWATGAGHMAGPWLTMLGGLLLVVGSFAGFAVQARDGDR
jgi:hypothetical protein